MINTQEEYYFRALENMLTTSEHVLRRIFQVRWEEHFKESWDYWKPTTTQVKKLLNKTNKHLYKVQKSKLEMACMGDWDMTLLNIVLTKYWDEHSYHIENEGVRELKNLRNRIKHNSSNMISQQEYNQMVDKFNEQLKLLGVEDGDIQQMIQEAEVTVIAMSSFVSSLEGINEFSTWSKLSFGIREPSVMLSSLLHSCLSGSLKDDKATIRQKKQIIRLLYMNFKQRDGDQHLVDRTVQLFKSGVNTELLQCVIHTGADVSVWGKQLDHPDNGEIEIYKLESYAFSEEPATCSERSFGESVVSEPACGNLLQIK
ncbi:unnamed protein product [Orchesella dallaii]|uniref:Swt1-like HEPN domain-containing protein n=1 Tax=Orchesella dallaii TaxID=48710 RepID=A0ABP1PLQ1_9HEXA